MENCLSAWTHLCRNTVLLRGLASLMLALLPPALSFAQSPAASETPAITAPATQVPVPEQPTPPPPPEPKPAPDPIPLALVLPLGSATYGRAAEAVRAGFVAAADATNEKYTVIGHGDGDVAAAFAKARESGARVVVGPLVRDDLKAIASAEAELPWTIALNQLDEGTPLPDHVYTLALSTESDGRQLARRAHSVGAQTVAVVTSDSPLQKRFASAFTAEWILLGGGPPIAFHFDRAQDVLVLLRRELTKTQPNAVLLAVDAQEAMLAKPYLGQLATYTSSQVNDRQARQGRNDLDDVVFVDIPWIADPAAAAFVRIPRKDYPNASLERLYALGLDAFRVAQAFASGAPAKLEFDGATGHLTLDASRQFLREGTLLQFHGGDIVPVETH
jgi:outer membrane PBP1 activator LpoA protein